MQAMELIRAEFNPQFVRLINYLHLTDQFRAAEFFRGVQASLGAAREEEDLLGLLLVLSTTAFQRFDLDPYAGQVVDRMLMRAQQFALTLSADATFHH